MSKVKRIKKKSVKRTLAVARKPVAAGSKTQSKKAQSPVHATAVRPETPPSEMFARGRIDAAPAPPITQTSSWRLLPVSARLWFRNYDVCIALLMLPILVMVLGTVLAPDIRNINNNTLGGILLLVIGGLWLTCNIPASYHLQLQAIQGKRPSVRQSYSHSWRFVPRLMGLTALVTLLVTGGLLLLIVPGVIMIRRYLLSPFYLMDYDLGIREAMARSAADSKPIALYVWGVYAVFLTINIFCIILLSPIFPPYGSIIGAFVTSLFAFGPALRYREVGKRQSVLASDPSLTTLKDTVS